MFFFTTCGLANRTSTTSNESESNEFAASEAARSTVAELVDDAFQNCDLNKDGRLSRKQFQLFCNRHPAVIKSHEAVLVQHTWSHKKMMAASLLKT